MSAIPSQVWIILGVVIAILVEIFMFSFTNTVLWRRLPGTLQHNILILPAAAFWPVTYAVWLIVLIIKLLVSGINELGYLGQRLGEKIPRADQDSYGSGHH